MPRKKFRPVLETLEGRDLPTFVAPVNINVGASTDGFIPNAAPVNVVTADFNGDGKIDLAVAHNSDNSIYILLGRGDGTFQAPVKYAISPAIQNTMRVGDFNGDGKLDIFVPGLNAPVPAIVLLGNGDGTFGSPIVSSSFNGPANTYPRGWAIGDLNGDGKLDVVCTNPSNSANSGAYTVLLGNGDGTFQAGIVGPQVLGYSRWVATGDFNGDGKLDLAVADGQGTSSAIGNVELNILLGNGNGTFQAPTHYTSPQFADDSDPNATANPEDVVVGDVNKDGKLDVIESDYDNTINVFLGNGDGTFQAARSVGVDSYPRDVVLADVNGDGKVDLVVSTLGIGQGGAEFAQEGYQPGYVGVLLGNGDGTYQPATEYFPFAYPGWTAVGDFNGDGSPDLAVTQVFDGHSVAVMLNNPSSTNLPPTVATDPSVAPNPVTGKTGTLSVLGADDGGAGNLTYTWGTTVAPPAGVAFNPNGTNAAQNTTATFAKAGTYYFKVTITDATGLSAIAMEPVTVNQTLTSITVAPASTSVFPNSTQQFTATGYDQFGTAMASQPTFTWTVSGGGTINSSGLFTAGATNGGPFTVTASSGGVSGTASLIVSSTTPPSTETWTGLGTTNNWSDAANWSANAIPGTPTTVIFDGTSSKNAIVDAGLVATVAGVQINSGYTGTVSENLNLTVTGGFSQAAGTFTAGANTLFVGGNFTVSGGTFNAGTGTVTFNESNTTATTVTVTANSVAFNNVTVALGNPTSGANLLAVGGSGALTVNGTFTYAGGALTAIANGTFNLAGDLDDQKFGGTGSPVFVFNGTGNQTIRDSNPTGSGSGNEGLVRNLIINKPSGTLSLTANLTVFGSLTLTAGTVNTGNCAWLLGNTNQIITDTPGGNLGNLTLGGTRTVNSTSLQAVNVTFVVGASPALTAPTGSLSVSGNWNNAAAGTFTPNGGTVVFDGNGTVQQLTSGAKPFNNLTVAAGASVQLEDNLTISGVFINRGTIDKNGHTITYTPALASITVSPATASVPQGFTQSFSATGLDQLGATLTTQPTFTWSVSGLGSVNSSGLYSAPAPGAGAGSATVTASSGGVSSPATVTVTSSQPPTVATPAAASPNPVTGTTTALSVLGADANYAASTLTYTWVATGTPPAPVSFSVNGTNAARNTTATFTKAGTYGFQVTITNPANLTVTSSVSVTVNLTLSSIVVSPATTTVVDGALQSFSAVGYDQFGAALAPQPSLTWSVTGLGSINSSGLYYAPGYGTGTDTVRATSSGVSGTANVTLSAGVDLLRMAPAAYGDGISTPAGATLPSARAISNALSTQTSDVVDNRYLSDFVYVWGQFIDHDLDLTPANTGVAFNIPVPKGDPYFDPTGTGTQVIAFDRSNYDPATGTSTTNPRQQTTVVTGLLDGSMIYGSNPTTAAALRSHVGGQLKTGPGDLLPLDNSTNFPAGQLPMDNQSPLPEDQLFAAGDVRANENIELTALQTLFVREHNRLAAQIAAANPGYTDDQIYQAARQQVVAEIQAITYDEFLPALLGGSALGAYTGYNPSVNPAISTEFSTAAYRFGHSMLDNEVERLDNNGQPIPEGSVDLSNAFFNPGLLNPSLPNHEGDIDPILKGDASGVAQAVDPKVVDAVRNFLFGPPGAGGFDLVALDIQRGRDDGLADYNTTRVAYGLPAVHSFADITSDPVVQAELASVYPDVNHIDLFAGLLAEDHVAGSSVGPLTQAILLDQFQRLRSGDPNWFERTFAGQQLQSIQSTTLADVIRDNTSITNLQDNVFVYFSGDVTASPGTVTGTTTTLSVADGGRNFTYTWSVTSKPSGAHPTFSKNATSDAGTTLVTFDRAGSYTFQVTLTDAGGLMFTDSVTVTVTTALAQLQVAPSASSPVAGVPFTVTVTAQDQFSTPMSSYTGTVSLSSTDPLSSSLGSHTFVPGDAGVFSFTGVIQEKAGPQTLTATNGTIRGTQAVTVSPAPASQFLVSPSTNTPTAGTPFTVTITAQDPFNNTATGYTGYVTLTSTDPQASFLGSHVFATANAGVWTLSGLTVVQKTLGTQTLTATNGYTTSSANITVSGVGLYVTALTPTPTGFTVSFSKPFLNSPINLYDAASASYGFADVTLVGQTRGTVRGSLILNTTSDGFTFLKTGGPVGGGTAGLLAPDTYTATIVSGVTAFQDSNGAPLNGNGFSPGNYMTTFTVASSSAVVVTIPDFARGPDSTDPINVPNTVAGGIPIALSTGAGVTDGTFVLQYDANLLSITGATVNPVLNGASFAVSTSGSGSAAQASITFHTPTALASGPVQLGGLIATVPATAPYKAKELLHFLSVSLNGGAIPAINDDSIHVVAFPGDNSGDGTYTSQDAALQSRVAAHADSGLGAFPVVDPALLADLNGDGSINSGDGALLNRYLAGTAVAQLPNYPGAPGNNPTGPDPALSLSAAVPVSPDGTMNVQVFIDDPRPAGSAGMTQAVLALRYDPAVLSVSAADILPGTVPSSGTGWVIQSTIDAAAGELGIILFSTTPISNSTGGSLVAIHFHVQAGATVGPTLVQLVDVVNPTGRHIFQTAVDDTHGPFTLHVVPSDAGSPPPIELSLTPAETQGGERASSLPIVNGVTFVPADDLRDDELTSLATAAVRDGWVSGVWDAQTDQEWGSSVSDPAADALGASWPISGEFSDRPLPVTAGREAGSGGALLETMVLDDVDSFFADRGSFADIPFLE